MSDLKLLLASTDLLAGVPESAHDNPLFPSGLL